MLARAMIFTARHTALTALSAATAIATVAWLVIKRRRALRPSSSYLRRASLDPTLVADRRRMIELYLQDVAARPLSPPPPKPPSSERGVRLVTWNLNILCGPDWHTAVSAADVSAVLQRLDADVLVLQELPCEALDTLWDAQLAAPMARVRELDGLLKAAGYHTVLRSPAENATVLATRLRVLETDGFLLDEVPTATLNGAEVWAESRGALYAALATDSGECLGVYATHLSHKDATLVRPKRSGADARSAPASASDGSRAEPPAPMRQRSVDWASATTVSGVRRRQAEALTRHWEGRAAKGAPAESATTSGGGAAATGGGGGLPRASDASDAVVLADFNQPLAAHYDAAEWRVVAAGLSSPAVAQPIDDGVAALLARRGWRCAYASCERSNFGAGRRAPPMTHWTGTTVDFAYLHGDGWRVRGAYVEYSPLSDHLPVVVDLVPRT